MYELIAKKTFYDRHSLAESKHFAQFLKTMTLPFVPFCGLQLSDGPFLEKIEDVLWDNQNNRFVVSCEVEFVGAISLNSFEDTLNFSLGLGWDEKRDTRLIS